VTVTVSGNARSAVVCDPGVFPGSRLQLATNGQSTHPVEGTLVAVGTSGPPASRAVGGRLVPLSGDDVPCDGASVVRLTLGDYGRLVAGGAR